MSEEYNAILEAVQAYLATEKTTTNAGQERPRTFPERIRDLSPEQINHLRFLAEHELVALETGVYKDGPNNPNEIWDFVKKQIQYRLENNIMPYSASGIEHREQELKKYSSVTEIKIK